MSALLDTIDPTAHPDCDIPTVSPGTTVQYATTYDSNIWNNAAVLEKWGQGRLTVEYTNAQGTKVRRENVCYHEDPFAKWRPYYDSCITYGEGGVWKLDDSSSLMQQKLDRLQSQIDAMARVNEQDDEPADEPKPVVRRKRRTRAEMEAARQAESVN